MVGGSANKPIVFVFGTQKGDADGRKKNLSAINTQVAYRAHERRREKKSRQRAQAAKEDDKVDQQPSPTSVQTGAPSVTPTTKLNNNDSGHQQSSRSQEIKTEHRPALVEHEIPATFDSRSNLIKVQPLSVHFRSSYTNPRPLRDRRSSDLSSETISDHDGVWSPSSTSNQYSTPATELSSVSPPSCTSLVTGYFEKGLDPFFRTPTIASDREKWLVHFYFREMGHIGFGTHTNSLFCPDRDWVSAYVSSKSLCFQWVLILAEEQLGRMGALPDQTLTIERKAKAYGHLSSILQSKVVDRDEGISGIMYAAIIDSSQTSMHLMALDRFIDDSGGLDAFLDGPLGISHPEHVATVYAFGKCPITSMENLLATRTIFLTCLHDLYLGAKGEQSEKKRIRNRRPWDSWSHQVVDDNGTLVPSNYDEHFRYYTKAQDDCMTADCLAPLLNSSLDTSKDFTSQARHFAVLIQISLILGEFEENYLARAMFLKRLKFVAESSTAREVHTGRAQLSHAGLLLINAYVRQEVQTYIDRTKSLSKAVKISKTVIDGLKIFGLLSHSTRSVVVSWLRDWLVSNENFDGDNFAHLPDHSLAMMSDEIMSSWMMSIRSREEM